MFPVSLTVNVEVIGGVEKVVGVPGLLIVEHGLTQLALDQLLCWTIPLLCCVVCLQVLLQVELDHVLMATQMTVEHRVWLSRDVHLDLLAWTKCCNWVDKSCDSLMT